jgi:hypothetical protein
MLKKRGEKNSIRYDLCKVSVKGTNLFCGGNKGIPRDAMPQAKGEVVKGSKAEKLLAKQNAKRVKNGKKPKMKLMELKTFWLILTRQEYLHQNLKEFVLINCRQHNKI